MQAGSNLLPQPLENSCLTPAWGCWFKQTNPHSAEGSHLLHRIRLIKINKNENIGGYREIHPCTSLAVIGKGGFHWSAPIVKTMASNEIDSLLKYSLPSQKKKGVYLFVWHHLSQVQYISLVDLISFYFFSLPKAQLVDKTIARLPSSGYIGQRENCHLRAEKCSL